MEKKNLDCPCKRVKCPRHGDCRACKAHHRLKNRTPPACERTGRTKGTGSRQRSKDTGPVF